MKKTYTAVFLKSVWPLASGKLTPLLLCAALAGAICFCPAAFADPQAGVTNGNTVLFQGDQSAGVGFTATDGGPTSILVSNISSGINVTGTGVAIAGQINGSNLTAVVDTNVAISTSGNGAFGIFAGNAGVFDGSYQLATNSFTVY